jgi:hypothetical protein
VRLHIAGGGPLTPFYQLAHELSHSLGTVDMYNTGQGNSLLTLMGGYDSFADDQVTVHLDIWHKLMLGWAEPKCFQLLPGDTAMIREGADGAIILVDTQRLASEYFIIERRRPKTTPLPLQPEIGRNYDLNFPGDGILIWRVHQGITGHLGAPDLALGGNGVWQVGQQTPTLTWSDGTLTNASIKVVSVEDDFSIRIEWS